VHGNNERRVGSEDLRLVDVKADVVRVGTNVGGDLAVALGRGRAGRSGRDRGGRGSRLCRRSRASGRNRRGRADRRRSRSRLALTVVLFFLSAAGVRKMWKENAYRVAVYASRAGVADRRAAVS
jgi:hypothetical protein